MKTDMGRESGNFRPAGGNDEASVAETERLLEDPATYVRPMQTANLYGDRRAPAWIATAGHRRPAVALSGTAGDGDRGAHEKDTCR
jgi:hypothetical protein